MLDSAPTHQVRLNRRHRFNVLLAMLTVAGLMTDVRAGLGAELQTPQTGAQPKATAAAFAQERQKQVQQIRPSSYDLRQYPVSDANESHWRKLLWATAIVQPQAPYIAQALSGILTMTARSQLSPAQMRTVDMGMQVGTQLYLANPTVYSGIGQQFRRTIASSSDPQWVAMALSALVKAKAEPGEIQSLSDRIRQRFPHWSQNPYLQTTLRDTAETLAPTAPPPLKDLLNWTLAPNQLHLYVICRPDRGVLCRAVLKDRQGQFVRENGQVWSVPLLLKSLHGLGWNFIRGQTPQGIYRIEGTVPQPDDAFFHAYGQFALVKQFLPGQAGSFKGSLASYQALLPPSWRNYFPIQQSYWAGKIGRSLFRIHGSGEAPTFFSDPARAAASANWNLTIGCLSALELYDETGRLVVADMPKILNALTAAGGPGFSGYLVIVEVPGAEAPISVADIQAALPLSTAETP
jgi:hypothetical protein